MFVSREPGLDIVIPTFNNLDELRRCLRSVEEQDGRARVLVCVDGSTDGTLQWLRSSEAPSRLLVLEHGDGANHGRAATRNLALPHLDGPFVLLLDSDMKLAPGTLKRHLEVLRSRRCVSVGSVQYENARQNLWARFLMTRGANKSRSGSNIRPLDFVTANTAMRTEDLVGVGGFDATLSGYGGEDTELALRLHQRDIQFVFNADAVATSVETKSAAAALEELRRYGATNLRTTRARHPELPAPYLVDRLESGKLPDRLFAALLNPVTDAVTGLLLRIPWFPLQQRMLNYQVLRAVWSGYGKSAA